MQPSANALHVDVLIAGGGFAGLALAVALRQALGSSFVVCVADPALAGRAQPGAASSSSAGAGGAGAHAGDMRASAIVAAARRLLQSIGAWEAIDAQPILDMKVTDSRVSDVMRPTFLTFAGEVAAGEPFAHMVENAALLATLQRQAQAQGVLLRPTSVTDFSVEGDAAQLRLGDASEIVARLVVGADGAHSAIRERAGIAVHGWRYDQCAIVTTVAHERDHHGRAEEHFLPGGPFAILPLTGRRCSIVWTEQTREAERIMTLADAAFHLELEQRFGLELGEIAVVGPRHIHPLSLSMARAFVADRVALIGDAAHVIHPIAGQGLNMGLKDVAALAEVIVDAVRLGLDPGSLAVLDRYQRWRRFDTAAMSVMTDGLNRLFSNQSDVLRLVRDVGLGIVDRMPGLKQLFVREAAGLVGEVPRLLRGEIL
ncbi:MAG: ubiquinone biosynthesis hydroxylase [Xanthobacteraceae bacterium]